MSLAPNANNATPYRYPWPSLDNGNSQRTWPRQHTGRPYHDNPLQIGDSATRAAPLARSANRGSSRRAGPSSPGPSPTPTADQLAGDVARLARVREAGRARLRQLEDEGAALREETRQVRAGKGGLT